MRSLILIAAFLVSAAHTSTTKQDTPLKVLQRIEFLLNNQQKQQQIDRDQLEAQEKCYDLCERRFGEWSKDNIARQECAKKCSQMPHPPLGGC